MLRYVALVCLPLMAAALDGPQGVRVALGATPAAMSVSWNTVTNVGSTVWYGTSPTALSSTATGTASNYTTNLFVHNVVVSGLRPATQYFYKCGDSSAGTSGVFSFTTSVPTGSQVPLEFAVYGDMGVKNSEATVASLIDNLDAFDAVLHLGDVSYADDRLDVKKDYESIWDSWQAALEPVAARKPYMILPGNHDVTCHSFGNFFCPDYTKNFTAYRNRFNMPAAASGSEAGNLWYSFDVGMVHFVFFNTESDLPGGGPEGVNSIWKAGGFAQNQLAWLTADLEGVNRTQTPWVVVGGHRPLYTSSDSGGENIIWPNATGKLRAAVEDLFHAHNVDMYLCGHVHAYERMYPVLHNKAVSHNYTDPHALTHIVVGSAGNIEGVSKWGKTTPEWLATRSRDYGYGRLRISSASNASWTYVRASDGAVLDSIDLIRTR